MEANLVFTDAMNRPVNLREVLNLSQQQLFDRGYARARLNAVTYAGSLYPPEAWLLIEERKLLLVDVRTSEELIYVGRVPGAAHIAWQSGVDMINNPRFTEELGILAERETAIALLCRSGKRSEAAAISAANAGFTQVFNVLEGFEGDLDSQRQRGECGGWRHWGLPWLQD
jgi:rhodanese-related sulfurtransferase